MVLWEIRFYSINKKKCKASLLLVETNFMWESIIPLCSRGERTMWQGLYINPTDTTLLSEKIILKANWIT